MRKWECAQVGNAQVGRAQKIVRNFLCERVFSQKTREKSSLVQETLSNFVIFGSNQKYRSKFKVYEFTLTYLFAYTLDIVTGEILRKEYKEGRKPVKIYLIFGLPIKMSEFGKKNGK